MELDKTEFLILGTKQQLAKVNIDNIKVGFTYVTPVPVETLDHASIHSSPCSAILISFVLLHFTTCMIFDAHASIYRKKLRGRYPCFHNVPYQLLQHPIA